VIFTYLSVLFDEPLAFLVLIGAFSTALFAGLTIHEFSHAAVADSLGDRTPRRFGRLSLNPKAHLDPIGSTMIFFVGFGWAKPVPVNPHNTANPKQTMALTSLAGPASNVVIAGLAGIPINLGLVPFHHPFVASFRVASEASIWTSSAGDLLGLFLGTVVLLNIILAVFNLLPIAPLDGFNAAVGLLPRDLSQQLAATAPWGLPILLLLLFLPRIGGFESPLLIVMGPVIDVLLNAFVGNATDLRFG
jgi:Zn-dependent protease